MKLIFLLGCLLSTSLFANDDMSTVSGGVLLPFFKDADETNFLSKKIPSFLIDQVPVTNENFLAFTKSHPEWKKSKAAAIFVDKNYLSHWTDDQKFSSKIKNSPVTNISWFAAEAYCQWKKKRLPTTDEWEVTAQASANSRDASRDPKFLERILNWYAQPTDAEINSVGKTQKNIYGVFDLHGLVWEWVYDFNSLMITEDSREDKSLNQKFYCGSGAYNSKDNRDYAAFMRYGFRSSLKASYTVGNLGFRCAKSPNEKFSPLAEERPLLPTNSLYNVPLEFHDQEGATTKLKSFQGQAQIISMIYTACPSVCPMTLQILKKIESQVNSQKLHFVLVSFDFNKDTSDVLKKFAQKHHLDPGQFTLLHGTEANVRSLAAALNLNYKQNSKGDFYHSNNISLLDKNGVLQFQEKSLGTQNNLINEVRKVLAE